MSYNYADYHHRRFNHHRTQPSVQLYHPAKTFQQPCNYYNGADPYPQSRYSTAGYHPWQTNFQPTSAHYSPAPQPLTCWDPPDLHGILDYNQQPPTGWPPDPPPPQSHSTALLQQPRKFINSGQQHGLPNNPDLMVRSFSPAQLAAVNDYNEKLRVYKLDQAALLARVTAWFEENTDDENITDANIDNTPTMVVSADVPKDIHYVPNNITDVPINTAIGVDMSDEVEQSEGSQDEAREMLRDNKVILRSALRVLPQNRMIGGQRLLDTNGVGQVPLKVLDIAMVNRNLPRRYAKEFFKLTRSRMFSKSVIAFDPGGETSMLLFSPTLFVAVASWFPP